MKNIYCAFLRGVNVNKRKMLMADVCELFESVKMSDVVALLATGNIIFTSDIKKEMLKNILEETLSNHYSYEVSLFIKNLDEVKSIIDHNPFISDSNLHIYSFINEPGFETTLIAKYNSITPTINEKAIINNSLFYWQVSIGETLTSGFSKVLGNKKLKSHFTSRNINTINKIYNKMITIKEH